MRRRRVFISSVQKEFAHERNSLRNYIHADPLMRRFFDVFLFEDLPAKDHRSDDVYLAEVARCDIYIGVFGDAYGFEDKDGISPTEREFDRASKLRKHRLIYVKGGDDKFKHAKMQALIRKASPQLIRRRFADEGSLLPAVYASLVDYLEDHQMILNGPFDGTVCRNANYKDLRSANIKQFIHEARAARDFPLKESASSRELLAHLNLLEQDEMTNAAVLLFAKEPQRFLPSSIVKCASNSLMNGPSAQDALLSFALPNNKALRPSTSRKFTSLPNIAPQTSARELTASATSGSGLFQCEIRLSPTSAPMPTADIG